VGKTLDVLITDRATRDDKEAPSRLDICGATVTIRDNGVVAQDQRETSGTGFLEMAAVGCPLICSRIILRRTPPWDSASPDDRSLAGLSPSGATAAWRFGSGVMQSPATRASVAGSTESGRRRRTKLTAARSTRR